MQTAATDRLCANTRNASLPTWRCSVSSMLASETVGETSGALGLNRGDGRSRLIDSGPPSTFGSASRLLRLPNTVNAQKYVSTYQCCVCPVFYTGWVRGVSA